MRGPGSPDAGAPEPERPDPGEHGESGRSGKRRRGKRRRRLSFWVELPVLIVVALGLAFLFQNFVARVYSIPSESMETTLHGCTGCYGDKILVDKVVFDFTEPAPGDVTVFRGPPAWLLREGPQARPANPVVWFFQQVGSVFGLSAPDERDFVKRIIAVGGQTVSCCDSENRVLVNGKPLTEPYLYWDDPGNQHQQSFPPVTVPPGTVWVMGDNRNNSCDSRCQGDGGSNGVVPVSDIIGKARFIVLPPSRWGGVSDINPQTGQAP
ncbi:signal peptidase I [Amycolatopsis taiwanensis]|uniref:signal peptidase I n=1 Tax=Amycolatopsis taiwanensis TaxID=342230 RepID=UPI002552A076|nr:signal peptidase I [Amycolatopsis taiwanensis]